MNKEIAKMQKIAGILKEWTEDWEEDPEQKPDDETYDQYGMHTEGASDVDELIRTLSSLISTNSNLSTADKEVMLPMLSQIQSVVDNMADDEDLDDSYDEPVSDYSKRRMRDRY